MRANVIYLRNYAKRPISTYVAMAKLKGDRFRNSRVKLYRAITENPVLTETPAVVRNGLTIRCANLQANKAKVNALLQFFPMGRILTGPNFLFVKGEIYQ